MTDHSRIDRRAFLGALAVTAVSGPAVLAQGRDERKIDPLALPLDKPETWTLHFRYKPPRIVTVDALDNAGKPAKKTIWYMWYQVYNMSGEPQTFLPEFELVPKDVKASIPDEMQPFIVEQLNKIENPTNEPKLLVHTSISISKRPIPPTLPDAIPRMVAGAAVWTDMTEKAPKTNRFSIYVIGLSNGLAVEEPVAGGEKLIKRKTLQINFVRPTDDNRPQITDIVPDDANGPAERWVYHTVSSLTPKKP